MTTLRLVINRPVPMLRLTHSDRRALLEQLAELIADRQVALVMTPNGLRCGLCGGWIDDEHRDDGHEPTCAVFLARAALCADDAGSEGHADG